MAETILITYATHTGSTKGIAEFIGSTLSTLGEKVTILPVQNGLDFSDYKAVIVGSAIQSGKLLPEALEFIRKNRIELSQKPFAIYVVCITLAMTKGNNYRSFVSNWLEPVRLILNPVSEGFFSGMLDIGKIKSLSDRIKFKLSVLLGVWKEGDHRDWEEINRWTRNLKTEIDNVYNTGI